MKDTIKEVYAMLQAREIHPSGSFDAKKRFYALHSDLINVRTPSAAYPFSELVACRTLKYVKAVCDKFECTTKDGLIANV